MLRQEEVGVGRGVGSAIDVALVADADGPKIPWDSRRCAHRSSEINLRRTVATEYNPATVAHAQRTDPESLGGPSGTSNPMECIGPRLWRHAAWRNCNGEKCLGANLPWPRCDTPQQLPLRKLWKVSRPNRCSPISAISQSVHDHSTLGTGLEVAKKRSSISRCESASNICTSACTSGGADDEVRATSIPTNAIRETR